MRGHFALHLKQAHCPIFQGTNSTITFGHCTIANNWHYTSTGTAVRTGQSSGEIILDRSVVATNHAPGEPLIVTSPPDIQVSSISNFTSLGYNVIGMIGNLNLNLLHPTDQFSNDPDNPLDPQFGSFRDYGDGRFILPPLPGGPLTEQIPFSYGFLDPFGFDVRSFRRAWNSSDIGAVQLERTSYQAWVDATGLPEGDAQLAETDFSGDGLTNRMAYFLGLDPTVFNPNPVELVSTFDGDFVEFVRSSTAGLQPTAENGISCWQLEVSNDLDTWDPHPATPIIFSSQRAHPGRDPHPLPHRLERQRP